MKTVSSAQMKEMDRRTIEEFGVPGAELMDRAGAGVAHAVEQLADLSGHGDLPVFLFAGRGNNGGDAFVAARYLKERGFDVAVWLSGEKHAVRGDARTHLNLLLSTGVSVEEITSVDEFKELGATLCDAGVVVDGVLGTGISGPVRGVAAGAIACLNALGEDMPVVAIDVPSGLNADTGQAEGEAVRADVTVTMAFAKHGLVAPGALDYVGAVDVIDIGIPRELADALPCALELVGPEDLRGLLPRRKRASHKGTFGRVLLVGGSPGYAGAMALAARAALRSGAGLVMALVPESIVPAVAGLVPEAMVHGGDMTSDGRLSVASLATWSEALEQIDAVLVGPGMTVHEQTREIVVELLCSGRQPMVLDADALNVFAGKSEELRGSAHRLILTPHPGEAGRLLSCSTGEVQQDRRRAAEALASAAEAVTLLKGAGTLVAAPGHTTAVNLTGNPGMATGGMGDALGGLLTGLLAQGIEPFAAACLAAYLHGLAGDASAWSGSQATLTAGDVIEALPLAFRRLVLR